MIRPPAAWPRARRDHNRPHRRGRVCDPHVLRAVGSFAHIPPPPVFVIHPCTEHSTGPVFARQTQCAHAFEISRYVEEWRGHRATNSPLLTVLAGDLNIYPTDTGIIRSLTLLVRIMSQRAPGLACTH